LNYFLLAVEAALAGLALQIIKAEPVVAEEF
jgi:hypothetical protein